MTALSPTGTLRARDNSTRGLIIEQADTDRDMSTIWSHVANVPAVNGLGHLAGLDAALAAAGYERVSDWSEPRRETYPLSGERTCEVRVAS